MKCIAASLLRSCCTCLCYIMLMTTGPAVSFAAEETSQTPTAAETVAQNSTTAEENQSDSTAAEAGSLDTSTTPEFTAEEQAYIQQHQGTPLVVAISNDMAPAEYYDTKSGSYAGFIIDIYNLISQKTGLAFAYTSRGDNADTKARIADGELQIISSLANSQQVANAMNVSLTFPFYTSTFSLVSKNTWSGSGDPDSIVAVKAGYPAFANAAKDLGYKNIVDYANFADCVEAVDSGKASIAIIPTTGENVLLGHVYYAGLTSIQLSQTNTGFCIGVANNDDTAVLLSILDKALADIPPDQITQIRLHSVLGVQPERTARDVVYENGGMFLFVAIVLITIVLIVALFANRQRRKANVALQNSNEQLQLALTEKEQAVLEARGASSAKSDFLSRMSHDMRTPLNAVLGFTRLAKDEAEIPPRAYDYLNMVESSGKYLLELINDVLDMSKIENGKLTLHEGPVSGLLFLQKTARLFSVQAQEKGITLVTDFEKATAPWIEMDDLRTHQIYANLLSNAIKFSEEGSQIRWTVTESTKAPDTIHVVSVISDQGCGISQENMQKIFQPFEQIDSIDSKAGAGLGLAIVKNLVELMGGTIRVESELGKGSSFIVELDRKLCEPSAGDAARAERDMSASAAAAADEAVAGALDCQVGRIKGASAAAAEMPTTVSAGSSLTDGIDLTGVRILMCEDNPVNVMVALRLLEKAGCVVECAEDGRVGVDAFAASKLGHFDAVLMDIRMPQLDGLAATRALRALDRVDAKTVPIIAMSANAFDEDVQKSVSAGMSAYLAKPVEPLMLYRTIAQQIGRNV